MLSRAEALRLGRDAGLIIVRHAGGEFVAPQCTDAVGALERLVNDAYAAGQAAERAAAPPPPMIINNPDVASVVNVAIKTEREACADLVNQLRDSICEISHRASAMRDALDQAEKHIRARGEKGGA